MKLWEIKQKDSDIALAKQMLERYRHFNQTLFNNQLPVIPIYFKPLKGVGGQVDCKIQKTATSRAIVPDSMTMTFSNIFKKTAEQLDSVLLHEMIHVYLLAVVGDFDDNHGPAFRRKKLELEYKTGIKIPITEVETDPVLNIATRPVSVIVLNGESDRPAYACIAPNFLKANLENFKNYALRLTVDTFDIFYIEDSAIWTTLSLRSPVQRRIPCTFYKLTNPEAYPELKKLGKEILSIPVGTIRKNN